VNYKSIKEPQTKTVYVIKNYSWNYLENTDEYTLITEGQLPIKVYDQGILFREFFANSKDYFRLLTNQHQFQDLTESNKTGTSYRTGIYMSKVEKKEEDYHFNLLRCSTNLNGPTDNFRESDLEIIKKVNKTAQIYFENGAELNHVLAQVYRNVIVNNKEKKAKIKEHSDKTKDMPRNGLMAFCTFYKVNDILLKPAKNDPFDLCYNDKSVLTILRFRKKSCVDDITIKDKFDVLLYPNSVFMMSLSTNRYYTHEIVPSGLNIEKLPIRLGYVIRCSDTRAIYKDGQTFLVEDNNQLVKLEKPSEEDVQNLKRIYYKENVSDQLIDYGNVHFSVNDGDYTKPIV
jgi:hypothetical protein